MSNSTSNLQRLAFAPRQWLLRKSHVAFITIVGLCFLPYISHAVSGLRTPDPKVAQRATLDSVSDSVSARGAGLSNQSINSSNGHDPLTSYAGARNLQVAMEQNLANPLSLAAADFDEDGVPDLLAGYSHEARGIISLRRGNVDSIYPNSPEAKQKEITGNFTAAPFLSPAHVFAVSIPPDFMGTGDFDADGHWDVVVAARGKESLSFLRGDGQGNFGEANELRLPGAVTALVTGEINRADGLADVVVAVEGEGGSQAVVYEGASGALKAKPESFPLSAPANALALGQLSSAYTIDLAVAAGSELLVVYGRDRKLSLPRDQQESVRPAHIKRRSFTGKVKSLVIGNLDDGPRNEIAVLIEGGEVQMLSRGVAKRKSRVKELRIAEWASRDLRSTWPAAERLIVANTFSSAADDLLLLDASDRRLRGLRVGRESKSAVDTPLGMKDSQHEQLPLAMAGTETVTVLPMQLDTDALTDLVMLRPNNAEPAVVLTANVGAGRANFTETPKLSTLPAKNGWSGAASAVGAARKPQTQLNTKSGTQSTQRVKSSGKESRTLSPLGDCPTSPIVVGQTINGSLATTDCFLDDGNYLDQYTFNGTTGQQVSITLDSVDFDAYLYLIGPDGSLVSTDDDSGGGTDARIPSEGGFITLPTNGTYTIYATSFDAEETGAYTLTLTAPGGGQCPATPIAGGQTLNGTLATSDCTLTNAGDRTGAFVDIYTFTGFAGQEAVVAMSSNTFDTYLYAIPPGDFPVLEDDDSGGGTNSRIPATGTVILPANGVYTILATSFATGATGSYTISLTLTNPPRASTVVTNTNDAGPGSLRQAILNANANDNAVHGMDTITFSIGSGPQTINVGSTTGIGLPEITDPVTINGTSQPGFAGTPLIELNGQSTPQGTAGLKITAGSSRVRGLVINRFGAADCSVGPNVDINVGTGIVLDSAGNNIIDGNFIGTNLSGTAALCNSGNGVFMFNSSNNTIGGTTPAARNIISGNRFPGIAIGGEFSTLNLVQGNYVGTNVAGTGDLGNEGNGIIVINGTNHVIGGTAAGAGNLVSGNNSPGIALGFSDPAGILVQGNSIGTNAAGTAAIANLGGGVIVGGFFQINGEPITATDNTIGGIADGAGNLISGNAGNGVEVINRGSERNKVQGNFIGLNEAGTAAIPNTGSGVFITRAPNNTIGGIDTQTGEIIPDGANLISGNTQFGVGVGIPRQNDVNPNEVITGGDSMFVFLNVIGTDINLNPLGNGLDGVFVDADSISNIIRGNIIAFNGGSGIRIPNNGTNPGVQINLDLNLIYSNNGIAIDLAAAGITPNDPLDADGGANLQQNFPELVSSNQPLQESPQEVNSPASAAAINVNGTLNSSPSTTYTVHWYFSNDAQCVANEAGSRPLVFGRVPGVNTNAAGTANFSIPLDFPAGITSGIINCSATDPQGNTSEYSACFSVAAGQTATTIQFSASTATATETLNATTKLDLTVTRSGSTSAAASVNYASSDGTANDHSDYLAALGTLRFAAGETTKTISVFIVDDSFGEGAETFNVALSNPVGGSLGSPSTIAVTINSNESVNGPNPVRDPSFSSDFFVRQHYVDFFNREADGPGLGFWKNQIDECTTQACREIRRINVSAAFFVSGEFQQTGYLVYKAYQASFNSGEQLNLQSFLPDTQEIGRGVIFGAPGADQQLETNKQRFFLDFVQRPAFLAAGAYPTTLTAPQFVDKLNANTFDPRGGSGGSLTPSERQTLINQLTDPTSPSLRAQVLRSVSENGVFTQRQFNKAFVLMQYFGYLRRNPNAAPDTNFDGYNFWLGKLNQFNGNFVEAEMVKAFITSGEYIQRFGP
ncbi:MAG: Calx-beta domain-containing protein [Pyrinomonadaceae bacterium]